MRRDRKSDHTATAAMKFKSHLGVFSTNVP
jgi:hypothetical protein